MVRSGLSILAAIMLAPAARAADLQAREFTWDQANAIMCGARGADDYLKAAAAYEQLAQAGARNASLFFNAGSALLQAGRPADAMRCFLRAERYAGNAPDIRRNMRIAQAAMEKDHPDRGLQWYRPLLFWHYNIAGPTRMTVAVVAFACVWVGLGLRHLGLRRTGARLLTAAVLILAVFGSSALTTWHAEATEAAVFMPGNGSGG